MQGSRRGKNNGAHGLVAVVATVLFGGCMFDAAARALPSNELELRCWQRHTRERTQVNRAELTAVEFSNLRDGWRVRSPLLVEFAVRGMGVSPAGPTPKPGTGHHHILINKPLPVGIAKPIPFDDHHRHFGKGQTSALLELPPGRHTLRLLFADHEHRPLYVFSREIAVEVLGQRAATPAPQIKEADFDATCKAWYEDQTSSPRPPDGPLFAANLRSGEPVTSPFNLHLGVLGLGVCARGGCPKDTGTFAIEVFDASSRRSVQRHSLDKGITQLTMNLPNGEYVLRLRLVDEAGANLLPPAEHTLRVTGQQAL